MWRRIIIALKGKNCICSNSNVLRKVERRHNLRYPMGTLSSRDGRALAEPEYPLTSCATKKPDLRSPQAKPAQSGCSWFRWSGATHLINGTIRLWILPFLAILNGYGCLQEWAKAMYQRYRCLQQTKCRLRWAVQVIGIVLQFRSAVEISKLRFPRNRRKLIPMDQVLTVSFIAHLERSWNRQSCCEILNQCWARCIAAGYGGVKSWWSDYWIVTQNQKHQSQLVKSFEALNGTMKVLQHWRKNQPTKCSLSRLVQTPFAAYDGLNLKNS